MTQEEKELLLKDLCSRLLYEVILLAPNKKITYQTDGNTAAELLVEEEWKPYLRSMSSMTEEEKKIQKTYIYHFSGNNLPNYEGNFVFEDEVHEYIDWLNANHFDYRGLIEKGLAIKVTEDNNPYKL